MNKNVDYYKRKKIITIIKLNLYIKQNKHYYYLHNELFAQLFKGAR